NEHRYGKAVCRQRVDMLGVNAEGARRLHSAAVTQGRPVQLTHLIDASLRVGSIQLTPLKG
ncbi:hypothetical protein Q5N24_018135, partial [Xanthomonas vasicola]